MEPGRRKPEKKRCGYRDNGAYDYSRSLGGEGRSYYVEWIVTSLSGEARRLFRLMVPGPRAIGVV